MTIRKPFTPTRRRFVQGTTAAAIAPFFIGRARADEPEFVIKVATVAPPGTPWAKYFNEVKKDLKEKTGGRVKIKAYFGGALGDEISTAEATKRGTIQVFGGSAGALASAIPELAVLELPYLFPTEKKADKVLDEVVREDLENLLWDRGYKLWFWSVNGYRSIGSTFPVGSPADLKGKKMRSQESDVHIETWKALDALPVPIAVTEVYSSLQTGLCEGFDNTPLFTFAASWHQAITHYAVTEHIYQPGVVVISRAFWETLPSDLQTIVLGDPQEMAKKSRRSVRAIGKLLLQNFIDAGITLNEMSDGDRAAFASKTEKVHDWFRGQTTDVGKTLLDKIKAAT